MLKRSICAFVAVSAVGLSSLDTYAISLGEFEYRNSCIQCHGASGKGYGWLGAFLNKAPSDPTVLQKNNGGVFPVERTSKIIEGSEDVRIHGPREMPIWGVGSALELTTMRRMDSRQMRTFASMRGRGSQH